MEIDIAIVLGEVLMTNFQLFVDFVAFFVQVLKVGNFFLLTQMRMSWRR